jgi:hypothetical protein
MEAVYNKSRRRNHAPSQITLGLGGIQKLGTLPRPPSHSLTHPHPAINPEEHRIYIVPPEEHRGMLFQITLGEGEKWIVMTGPALAARGRESKNALLSLTLPHPDVNPKSIGFTSSLSQITLGEGEKWIVMTGPAPRLPPRSIPARFCSLSRDDCEAGER